VQALCIELTMGIPRVPSGDEPPEKRRPSCGPVSPLAPRRSVMAVEATDETEPHVRRTTFQESRMRTGLRPVDGLFKRLEADFPPARLAVQERPTGRSTNAVESHAAAGRAAQRVRQGRRVFTRADACSGVGADLRRQNVGIGSLREGSSNREVAY
jgi:hypothetical protein